MNSFETLPFESTETTFSTNPFLPRMADSAGISSSSHNIVYQNEQPTYLPNIYNPFFNLENSSENSLRNTIGTNQNSGLTSASSMGHNASTAQWEQNYPSTSCVCNISDRRTHPPREDNARRVLNSWSCSSSNQLSQPTYVPNNNGVFGQPQVNSNHIRTISNSLPLPLVEPPNQFNQRVASEINPRAEIPYPDDDCYVVSTTVERRRYIYGRGEMNRRDEANSTNFLAAGSSNTDLMVFRTHETEITRDRTLRPTTDGNFPSSMQNNIGPLNCSSIGSYRSHPYMSIVPNSHGNISSEANSRRLQIQIRSRTPASGPNRDFPLFETINPTDGEINETRVTSTNGLTNNFLPLNTTNEVTNRAIIQEEGTFPMNEIIDEALIIDNIRPSISQANAEGLLNPTGNVQNGLPCTEIEYNVTNISNHNCVNNPIHNMTLNHSNYSRSNDARSTIIIQDQFRPICEQRPPFDMHEYIRRGAQVRLMENFMVPNYVNGIRTTSTQSQTENIPTLQSFPSHSENYKRKKDNFRSLLKPPIGVPRNFEIKVKRRNIFEDSYRIITTVDNVEKLKAKLWVVFEGEVGLDYGGVQREWFCILSREIFNPNYGFFEYCKTSNYSLQINPDSGICNEQHLNYFMFIGRVVGMAVYHDKLLDASFTQIFYKMLLQKKITLEDLKQVDPQYYKTLSWINENDPSHLEIDFTVTEEHFGQVIMKDLVPNGSTIPVTNQNKAQYINLFITWRFISRVKDQMEAFLMGFHDLIPKESIKQFNENELESLFCGNQEINIKDWKSNTLYSGGYNSRHVTIRWFWKLVKSFNNEMRAKLLQFTTGTSRVPKNGFKELFGSNGPLLFTIQNIGNCNALPRAHTCFNRLDLPPYESYEKLKEKLLYALEGCEGFNGVD